MQGPLAHVLMPVTGAAARSYWVPRSYIWMAAAFLDTSSLGKGSLVSSILSVRSGSPQVLNILWKMF